MRYTHEDVQQHGLLQFTGEQAVSPYAKFQVEPSKTVSGLVHLRCTYNNKYWVRWSETQYWISGGADNPEEDQSKWSCTLFKPVFVEKDDHKTVRFLHVQLNHYACLFRSDPPFGNFVYAGWEEPNSDLCDVCEILDWESLLVLPNHVAFKGDNGQYLCARWIEGHEYLEFSGSDLGDPSVGNEVFTNPDGSIRIKSDYFNKFWRRSPNWIWGDSSDSTAGNADTLFWPVKVGKSVVALRNYGNNYFCKRLTTEGKTSCLNAGVSTISKEAQIGVEELVISRSIYDVDFRLMDARIYDQSIVTMATGVASNGTSNPNTAKVKLSYTDTKSSTWSGNVSLKVGVKTTIKTGIPFLAEGHIEISGELSGGYTWGETNESSNTLETEYEVSVKPMSLTRISLLATRGSCDIPYSYTQRDTLTNGSQVTYRMDDGVYTGINSFNFKYETKEEKLVI
ncbi:unnamed protein product [Linum tenue]|uniref:Agglutinin domain-containing protein n=1 Tax=Linum tenue TaxID=586396 RepID=A0AAV0LMV5_9ROSI|nr:unnamed protein product [Linum tenue]